MQKTKATDHRLLIAVTGGIASGKSTVSKMLAEMGAPLIDLDVLARRVVEPGKPAWKEIVDFFGPGILLKDGRINRKRLADVVFRDAGKRKELESLTHPRILEEMRRQVDEIAAGDPDAIIQVCIPLLFELNLQNKFHKVIVVYSPPAVQIQRLMERDRISKAAAENILRTQLPMDEKLDQADFVIRNDGPLGETRRQVEEVWRKLKRQQRKWKLLPIDIKMSR